MLKARCQPSACTKPLVTSRSYSRFLNMRYGRRMQRSMIRGFLSPRTLRMIVSAKITRETGLSMIMGPLVYWKKSQAIFSIPRLRFRRQKAWFLPPASPRSYARAKTLLETTRLVTVGAVRRRKRPRLIGVQAGSKNTLPWSFKMKRNTTLLAALAAASPTLLLAAAPATTTSPATQPSATTSAARANRENAWFQRLDTNKDGAISKEEAQAAADQRIAQTFDRLDLNHDGMITQDEVNQVHEQRRAERQAEAAERFKQADTNGDGLLSKDEVNKAMPRLARAFDRLDTNHDGQLSEQELQAGREQMMARGGGRHWHHGPPANDTDQSSAPALK